MIAILLSVLIGLAQPPGVRVERVPEGGLQPRVVTDAAGTVHLVYFKGEPAAGDLFYAQRPAGADAFGPPIRVNAHDGSAAAIGTIRGAQLAVGPDGRPHVAWIGSDEARPRGPHGGLPLLYARLDASGEAFEPERNLAQWAGHLDGGNAIAVDAQNRVSVVWHGDPAGAGEEARAVYVARSADGGETFAREVRISPPGTGVCACCSLQAWAAADGHLRVLYRAARDLEHRDMTLLTSGDGGPFEAATLDPWNVAACPMSSSAFAEQDGEVLAAWQTGDRLFWQRLEADAEKRPLPLGDGVQKHPAFAVGEQEVLVAWTEGAVWNSGGAVAWQRYSADGRPLGEEQRVEGLPAWSFPAAFTDPDGTFVVMY